MINQNFFGCTSLGIFVNVFATFANKKSVSIETLLMISSINLF